jgi:hypothetical protein
MKQSLKEMKLEYIFEMHSFSTDLEDESVHRAYVDNNCTGQALVCRLMTTVNGR